MNSRSVRMAVNQAINVLLSHDLFKAELVHIHDRSGFAVCFRAALSAQFSSDVVAQSQTQRKQYCSDQPASYDGAVSLVSDVICAQGVAVSHRAR